MRGLCFVFQVLQTRHTGTVQSCFILVGWPGLVSSGHALSLQCVTMFGLLAFQFPFSSLFSYIAPNGRLLYSWYVCSSCVETSSRLVSIFVALLNIRNHSPLSSMIEKKTRIFFFLITQFRCQ